MHFVEQQLSGSAAAVESIFLATPESVDCSRVCER